MATVAAGAAVLLVLGVGVFALSGPGGETEEAAAEGEAVTIGMIPWEEAIAVTRLWEVVLGEMGYAVEVVDTDVEPVFQGVAEGDYDLFLDAWLPETHAGYLEEHGDDMEDLGAWYDSATLHVTVPAYVDEVDSIADLEDHADLFDGRIVGIEADSGLAALTEDRVLPEYGLDDYDHLPSSSSAMAIELDAAIVMQEPVVVTLWRPHLAYGRHDLKDLADPLGALGDGERLHALARDGFRAEHPEVAEWLSEFALDDAEIAELMRFVLYEYPADPGEGARRWLAENPDFLRRTLGGDAQRLDL